MDKEAIKNPPKGGLVKLQLASAGFVHTQN